MFKFIKFNRDNNLDNITVLIKITDSLYFKGKYVYVKLDKNGEINIHQIILAILNSKDTRYETPQSRIKLKRNIIWTILNFIVFKTISLPINIIKYV